MEQNSQITSFAYHPLTSGYILGKILENLETKSYIEIIDSYFAHFNIQCGYKTPASVKDRLIHHYIPPSSSTINGIDRRKMVEIFNSPTIFNVPSAGLVSTGVDLCNFGMHFLTNLPNNPLYQQAIRVHSSGLDLTFNLQASWGLFFMLSKESKLYGKFAPDHLIGHGGSTAHLFWMNPVKNYVACFLSDSHLSLPRSQKRDERLVQLIEEFIHE